VDWHTKQFRFLKGNAGLAEIKWKWSNREWRVFGYFNTAGYFVTVMGCTHKERYDPPDCLNTANRRMQEAQRGEWEICHIARSSVEGRGSQKQYLGFSI
jgi:hypothetical protein